ncbi:glycoside hydrolase family 6 protein [Streptomyces sp. NBC_00878]|uniref:glycoside hydrolase family 6 protein n=1 Tax=Streptomyces sp. NBC_00878 TaxID=2975854 RepID=UPI0022560F97|nr:glycoside hydrolase family 6 protein [Streptomyces sp. NBC_00878]MCX4910317.1 glycoside hydrolase family 6 protein [Streptomyces sp. NBC_00878]
MVAVASAVAVVGTVTGMMSALDEGRGTDEARPDVTSSPLLQPLPAVPTPTPSETSASPSPSPSRTKAKASPKPSKTEATKPRTEPVSGQLYRHPDSNVLDWISDHRDDPRRPVIESRIAAQPAAMWFADYTPSNITSRVRAVTSAGSARGQVPVVVPYAISNRDCGGASQGGAPDLGAYDGWIDKFAAGLGSDDVIVILEPDAIAQSDCLSEGDRAARFASLARAGRVLKTANPNARVYFDAGHSGWNTPETAADLLRRAGAASAASSDGIFSNVSNFHRTSDEVAYVRRTLDALGGPASLGGVIDTSRNGNGAPPAGVWCDPEGRKLGQAPTLRTGEARIDAYLWVKLPGESDGCQGAPGTFAPDYAYDLAR